MEIGIEIGGISRNRISYKLNIPREYRHYFLKDTCYVEYDDRIDISKIDESILTIPVTGAIIPTAWALGASINVPVLDSGYLRALERVKEPFRKVHPGFSFVGDIKAQEERVNFTTGNRYGMLFSGGVDSLTTYLRNKDKKPDLFSVWGVPDIPTYESGFWGRMWKDISDTADREGIDAFQIKSNIFESINHELLSEQFGHHWWGGVTIASLMLSLCAPITIARGISTLLIASSETKNFEGPTGSSPAIDNNFSWASGISVFNDGDELFRQEKMNYLCDKENLPHLSKLRVCADSASSTNCGHCEKCLRTIAAFVVEGVNPSTCNFIIDKNTFPYLADCFNDKKIRVHWIGFWEDIQKRAPEHTDLDITGLPEFLNWLRTFDFSKYQVNKSRHFFWHTNLIIRNRRIKANAVRRKIKSSYHKALGKRKPLQQV